MMRQRLLLLACLVGVGCGGDKPTAPEPDLSIDSAGVDASAPDVADSVTPAPEVVSPDTIRAPDTAAPSDSLADTQESTLDADAGPALPACNSLFAAMIADQQTALDPTFKISCDAPLTTDVGALAPGGAPMCASGESANACQTRICFTSSYASSTLFLTCNNILNAVSAFLAA